MSETDSEEEDEDESTADESGSVLSVPSPRSYGSIKVRSMADLDCRLPASNLDRSLEVLEPPSIKSEFVEQEYSEFSEAELFRPPKTEYVAETDLLEDSKSFQVELAQQRAASMCIIHDIPDIKPLVAAGGHLGNQTTDFPPNFGGAAAFPPTSAELNFRFWSKSVMMMMHFVQRSVLNIKIVVF